MMCLLAQHPETLASFPFSGRSSYCLRVRAERSCSVATPPPPQVNLAPSTPALPHCLAVLAKASLHLHMLLPQNPRSSIIIAITPPPEHSPGPPDSQELMRLQGCVGGYSIQANLACRSSTAAFWGQILSSPTRHYMNTGLNISSLTSKQLTHHA